MESRRIVLMNLFTEQHWRLRRREQTYGQGWEEEGEGEVHGEMTSYAILMISPILFHENKMMLPVISPTVFDNTATASVWSHPFHQ